MTKHVRKLLVLLSGLSVLLIGILMIFLPGPALAVIPAGLALLATEFTWAAKILQKTRDKINQSVGKIKKRKGIA